MHLLFININSKLCSYYSCIIIELHWETYEPYCTKTGFELCQYCIQRRLGGRPLNLASFHPCPPPHKKGQEAGSQRFHLFLDKTTIKGFPSILV